MSGENVETFRRGAEATNRGDIDAVLEAIHPEVVLEPLRAATEGEFVGRAGIRKLMADTAATFELFRVDYTEVRNLGDRVLAIEARLALEAAGLEG